MWFITYLAKILLNIFSKRLYTYFVLVSNRIKNPAAGVLPESFVQAAERAAPDRLVTSSVLRVMEQRGKASASRWLKNP